MWTADTRARYERKSNRYPSDVTDEEWELVDPHLPAQRRVDRREVMNAVLYVLTTGCQWRMLPKDFPPKSMVDDYFVEWMCTGILDRIYHALYVEAREQAGREASPTYAIIDAQSAKAAEKGGRKLIPLVTMQAKKVKGIKRHEAVDTLGLMIGLDITAADVQDRDGCIPMLKQVQRQFPFLEAVIAGDYQGARTAATVYRAARAPLQIVKRSDAAKGFQVCRNAGSSSELSVGSDAADGWPKTLRT